MHNHTHNAHSVTKTDVDADADKTTKYDSHMTNFVVKEMQKQDLQRE